MTKFQGNETPGQAESCTLQLRDLKLAIPYGFQIAILFERPVDHGWSVKVAVLGDNAIS